MRRREFVAGAASAAAWSVAVRAQQPNRMRRVGVLMAYSKDDAEAQKSVSAFQDSLGKLGWTEDRISIIQHWAGSKLAAIETAAKTLVKQEPDVILSSSIPTTAALLRESRTIPIVFAIVSDPVGSRFVKSFKNPGGNVTGFTTLDGSMGGKWLALLQEIVPQLNQAAFLFNPATATYADFYMPIFIEAGTSMGIVARAAPVATDKDIEAVLAVQAKTPHSGLAVMTDSFTTNYRHVIVQLAAQHRVPVIYPYRLFAQDGGLVAYGNNRVEPFRGAAAYVSRILHGERPNDLPVQPPTQFELVINLKTAKSLGLTIPPSLLARADEVIE